MNLFTRPGVLEGLLRVAHTLDTIKHRIAEGGVANGICLNPGNVGFAETVLYFLKQPDLYTWNSGDGKGLP